MKIIKEKENYKVISNLVYKDLLKYLSYRQKKLLKFYLANYTLTEITKILKIKKHNVLLEFILLGKKIGFYRLLMTKLMYPSSNNPYFVKGFYEAINNFKGVLKNEIILRKTKRAKKKSK